MPEISVPEPSFNGYAANKPDSEPVNTLPIPVTI